MTPDVQAAIKEVSDAIEQRARDIARFAIEAAIAERVARLRERSREYRERAVDVNSGGQYQSAANLLADIADLLEGT